jgi:Na+-driven multidrug efflux pump
VLKLTILCATCVTTTGFLVGMFIPRLAVSAFTTDETLIGLSANGLRIILMCFPLVGFQMVTSNFFQSIGIAKKAIFLSLTRQVLFLLPCVLLLPLWLGADGIWWSMPISDLLASVTAAVLLYRQLREFKRHKMNQI